MVIDGIEELGNLLLFSLAEFDRVLGHIADLAGDDLPTGLGQPVADRRQIFDLRQESGAHMAFGNLLAIQRLQVLGARLDGIGFGIPLGIGMGGLDDPEAIEEERHAAGLAQLSILEEMADLGSGPVPVVGQALDDHRHLVGSEAFIQHGLEIHLLIQETGALLDGALDGVLVDAGLLGLFNGGRQPGIGLDFRAAQFGGDHDFAGQLADHLTFFLRGRLATRLLPLGSHAAREAKERARTEAQRSQSRRRVS